MVLDGGNGNYMYIAVHATYMRKGKENNYSYMRVVLILIMLFSHFQFP